MSKATKYMQRCLQLANKGLGFTAPNPMVGAVLVYQDKIIGEGFTSPFGGNHAEVNCINSVAKENEIFISKATLYVSLEPCSHYGKTPPCSNLIVNKRIKHVVIGAIDSNELVSGNGIKYLEKNGCNVEVNVLKKECLELNKRFFTFHKKKRPYIILKWAQSMDGFIGKNNKKVKEPIWISNTYSKQLVHLWRSQEQSILVGKNTVLEDNPTLNTRLVKGKNPIRITFNKNKDINLKNSILDNSIKTICFVNKNIHLTSNTLTKFIEIDFEKDSVSQMINYLFQEEIQSVIIEGGAKTLQSFIDLNLWDEARIFQGNIELKNGIKSPVINGKLMRKNYIKKDTLYIYKNEC